MRVYMVNWTIDITHYNHGIKAKKVKDPYLLFVLTSIPIWCTTTTGKLSSRNGEYYYYYVQGKWAIKVSLEIALAFSTSLT